MPILKIPMEFYKDFKSDAYMATRDIACIPSGAVHPFLPRKQKLEECLDREFINPFNEQTLQFDSDFGCEHDDYHYRYMHVDLSYMHDSVGIAMCHIPYWTTLIRKNTVSGRIVETKVEVPFIKFDFIGSIKAESGEQIVISDIREEVIMTVSSKGYYLNLITFDRFQSQETIQELRKQGFTVGNLSLDRTVTKLLVNFDKKYNIEKITTEGQHMSAWQSLKDVINDGRAKIPYHEQFLAQAKSAEVSYVKKKVYSAPRVVTVDGKEVRVTSSLDLLEAMAGAVFNAITNEFGGEHEIRGPETKIEKLKDKQEKEFFNDLEEDSSIDIRDEEFDFEPDYEESDWDDGEIY